MDLVKANGKVVSSGNGLITGFIVPFSDRRQVSFRHG